MSTETSIPTTELKIEGMSCTHCQAAVLKALEGVSGVVSAEVDLAAGRATVRGSAASEQLVAAIADEGYSATALAS